MARLIHLIPAAELAPGQIAAIRNSVTNELLALASRELKMSVDKLVARDIRPYSDIKWATDTNATDGLANSALSTDIWQFTTDATLSGWLSAIASAYRTMGDQRYIAIYGIRDGRMTVSSPPAPQCTLWRIRVGNSDKVIWDLSKCYAYPDNVVGICPSPVVIPQNTQFNIYGYLPAAAGNAVTYVSFEGIVVEPRGKVVTP